MHLSDPVPPVYFRVLADLGGAPAALLLEHGHGAAPALAALVAAAPCAGFPAQLACLYRPGGDPALAAALELAGWRALAPTALLRADAALPALSAPTGAAWIDGDWFLAAPAKAPGAHAASRMLALQLVQRVAADADTHEIENLLRQDPTLSYQLLRLVNSLGMGVGRKITSFAQALLILGRQQLRRWLNLMLFAARQGDVRSGMLLARVAVRASALEQLAKLRGLDKPTQEQAFMAGMFSLLGVLFGLPLAELLAPLPLGEAVQDALLDRGGELGALLALVETAERADFDALAAQLAALQLSAEDFNASMADASAWMLGALRESQGGANG